MFLNTITTALAAAYDSTASLRHPPIDSYYMEYVPLIRRSGGVRLFEPSMPFKWFIPAGGLRGELRRSEQRYLALLIREAERRGRIPVFGFCRSLGRISAIKQAFGGLNVFLFRNLWAQWASYIDFKRRNDRFFISGI